MTGSGGRRLPGLGGRAWQKPTFLAIAVLPVVLVWPIIAARPVVSMVILVVGVLGGVAFMFGDDPDDGSPSFPEKSDRSTPRPPVPGHRGHETAGRTGAPDPGASPAHGHDRVTPGRYPERGSGNAGTDTVPVAVLAPDPPIADPAEPDTAPDGPLRLDGGTRAGRSPWRLPDVQGHPGIAADAALVGDLEVRAASIIGPGHRCESPATPRQDAYALACTASDSHLVIAVADGVSSSPHSDLGARVAVSAAVKILAHQMGTEPRMELLRAAHLFQQVAGQMIGTGQDRKIDPHDICSLLIVAVVPTTPERDGRRRVWTAQVGDVSLWLHGPDGWIQRTGSVKSGPDSNRVTSFLPYSFGDAVTSLVEVPAGHLLAVMTDGLGDVLSKVAGAQEHYGTRWDRPPDPARFVADLCLDAQGQLDDRTAVVVWCGPPITAGER